MWNFLFLAKSAIFMPFLLSTGPLIKHIIFYLGCISQRVSVDFLWDILLSHRWYKALSLSTGICLYGCCCYWSLSINLLYFIEEKQRNIIMATNDWCSDFTNNNGHTNRGWSACTFCANKAIVNYYISQEPDNHLRLSSSLKRYDHLYNLTVTYKDGVTKKEREQTFKK